MGICRTVKSGWLSPSLNNIKCMEFLSHFPLPDQLRNRQTFAIHAQDDRYAEFFSFVEEEVAKSRRSFSYLPAPFIPAGPYCAASTLQWIHGNRQFQTCQVI
jgi:hypothetical protein